MTATMEGVKALSPSSIVDKQFSYYNFDKIMSYNAVFNFLIGARGLGKTYGAKKMCIKKSLRTIERGVAVEQFIYLRRYKEELKKSANTFFADVQDEFPDWDFKVQGHFALASHSDKRDDKKRVWHTIGYFIPLSTAQSQKSVAFPQVKTIIFDEFIIEKGAVHYLSNEHIAFQNFFSTVDRWKDKTRVLFLANAVDIMNPYFLGYNIKPDEVGELFTMEEGFVLCHFADSAEFSSEVYATRFGRFIEGTEYADYAVTSEFINNHDALVGTKPSEAKYNYTIETKQGIFSVWSTWTDSNYYIQEKRPKEEHIYTMIPEKMANGKTFVGYNDRMVQVLRTAWRHDHVLFDSSKSRNAFTEVFKR